MKKFFKVIGKIILGIVIAFVVLILIGIFAGGSTDSKETTSAAPTTETVSTAATNEATEPIDTSKGTLDDCYIEILDSELIKDSFGNEAIAVHIRWTNNSDTEKTFWTAFEYSAYQNGIELDRDTFVKFDYDDDASIKPGATFELTCAYELRDSSAPVDFEMTEFISFSDDMLYKQFIIDPNT